MARSARNAELRQQELSAMLARGLRLTTGELARRFGVNPMTIRRDLKALEDSGAAIRCYGGAVPAQRISFEFAFDQRRRQYLAEKCRIGEEAADRVGSGQMLFLDTGTTTLQVARALVRRKLPCLVITSSLVIASELWACEPIELILLGGRVRHRSPDLAGPGTEQMLERLSADVAFLGTDGVDPERGSFAGDLETARIAERMAAGAKRVVVVADHTKIGRAGPVRYLPVDHIDEVITDREADRAAVVALKRQGVRVNLV